jgi:hypothetical protein
MIRTQIQLEPTQERLVRRFAERERISMAEAIRRCIDNALGNEAWDDLSERYRAAAGLVGALSGGQKTADLSENHDAYLDEVFD